MKKASTASSGSSSDYSRGDDKMITVTALAKPLIDMRYSLHYFFRGIPHKILARLFFLIFLSSCTADNSSQEVAEKAFAAWATGEKSGNYDDFKAMLDTNFIIYAHPLTGSFSGKDGLEKMHMLIVEREKVNNHLTFSAVSVLSNEKEVAFAFQSEGTVAGGLPYKGANIIVMLVEKDKIKGFKEYFGSIDPAWFKK